MSSGNPGRYAWAWGTVRPGGPDLGAEEAPSATEELARALARFLAESAAADPWAKYPPVLTVEHVAEILGRERSSVSEACRRGAIPPMKKRLGRYVADQVAFRAWLSGGAA